MQLSLSVRIVEAACKTRLQVVFEELVGIAADTGYQAVCMRASAGGVQTPNEELRRMREVVESRGLHVAMVTADSNVPLNNADGPNSLRKIGPSQMLPKNSMRSHSHLFEVGRRYAARA